MLNLEAQFPDNAASVSALKVVKRLTSHGYQAYLVGGCVRDLLLGKSPKDFDVATNAHPEEIRQLFRNSRAIGRRFKIVHIRFGGHIIEVATFRAPHSVSQSEANITDFGRILSDNIYGTFEEDIYRRDFTMNALYYDADRRKIIDAVDGLNDIAQQRIQLIGDPQARYREDPVRMLRAVRFKAKLQFEIATDSAKPLRQLGFLLKHIPPARLFEEALKLFMFGHGQASLDALIEFDLFGCLFAETNKSLHEAFARKLIGLALSSTDERIAAKKTVTPAFVYAALLWPPFLKKHARLLTQGYDIASANMNAFSSVISKQQQSTAIPKRFAGAIRDILHLQFYLPNRSGKKAQTLLAHRRFRAAYDFLLLREAAGEDLDGLGNWWTEYQLMQPAMPKPAPLGPARTKRGRRFRQRK